MNKKTIDFPSSLKKRIPFAEWLGNPQAWDKKKFISETEEFMFEVHGAIDPNDRHTLAILADQMDVYVRASIDIDRDDLVILTNSGKTLAPHPAISVRNNAILMISKLWKELGLTLTTRLANSKANGTDKIDELLKGPKRA